MYNTKLGLKTTCLVVLYLLRYFKPVNLLRAVGYYKNFMEEKTNEGNF